MRKYPRPGIVDTYPNKSILFNSYSGHAYKTTYSVIGIYLNEVRNLYIYDREPSSGNIHSNIGYVWTFVLQVNDKVHLQIDSAQLYVDDDQRFFFNGWLLNTI